MIFHRRLKSWAELSVRRALQVNLPGTYAECSTHLPLLARSAGRRSGGLSSVIPFSEMSDTTSIGNVLIGLGCVQLAGGAIYVGVNAARRRGRVRIEGTVVEHDASVDEEGTTHYEPIVEYVAPTGERRRVKCGVAFSRALAVDGSERRNVWHDPGDPTKSYVDVRLRAALPIPLPVLFLVPVVILAIGLALRLAE